MNRNKLTEPMRQAIQMIIMDRWSDSGDTTGMIAQELGIARATINRWRKRKDFKEEYERQLESYRSHFDDIQLADRKERVKALERLYGSLSDKQVSQKMQILESIRREVGDDKIQHEHQHKHTIQGVNTPPRADSYEEWLKQNQQMQAIDANFSVEDTSKDSEPLDSPPALPMPVNRHE